MTDKIDLRSDTVTRPSEAMLSAMHKAEVGDDVFGEDPTVNKLEQKAAEMFGKEAGLFCPSGTMTNQIAIKVHTRPGDEVICDETSHIYNYEGGGIAFNSGCSVRLLNGEKGRFTVEDVIQSINPDDVHKPVSRLVSIENTSNRGGGSIWDIEDIKKINEVCKKEGLKLHLDGARIFNALVETGESPEEHGGLFDSISICLSKGLGAPAGSLLLGETEFIRQARRIRKIFGGGMRQAGYLAAAGIFALDHNIHRLKEDHRRASELKLILEELPFVEEILPVTTNIVVFKLDKSRSLSEYISTANEKGLKLVPFGPQTVRMVTHLDFTDEMLKDIKKLL